MRALAVLALGLALCTCAKQAPVEVRKDIDFRAALGRHGEWLVVRPYGRVWHPPTHLVGEDYVPYLKRGQWTYEPAQGWVFQAEDAWGDFTFHYGRWFLERGLGWVWWPDQEYAPAWVDWRAGADFIAWSPRSPPPSANATIAPPPQQWLVVRGRHFTQPDLTRHLLPQEQQPRALELAAPVPGQRGPDLEFVRAQGGLTADGGVPDLTPPPEPSPPPQLAPADETPPEEPPPPPPKKKTRKKGKRGR